MTRFSRNHPSIVLTSVLSLAHFSLFALASPVLATSNKKKHTTPKPPPSSKKTSTTTKPKLLVKQATVAPPPQVIVIPPTARSAREAPRPKAVAMTRPLPPDSDDENTINVRLETGDEELDHTQGGGDDQIGKIRADQESNLGPRNGRSRSYTKLVSRALSYRGARYRFGATGGGGAFDCSGFVQYLMRTEGVSLSRTAADQFNGGRPVAREDLQAGDLVFFRNTYKHGISHVGMYVGDGSFVHAASQKRGVVVDPLDLPYYNAKYAGARRYK